MGFDVKKYVEERNGKTTAVPENKKQGFDVESYVRERQQKQEADNYMARTRDSVNSLAEKTKDLSANFADGEHFAPEKYKTQDDLMGQYNYAQGTINRYLTDAYRHKQEIAANAEEYNRLHGEGSAFRDQMVLNEAIKQLRGDSDNLVQRLDNQLENPIVRKGTLKDNTVNSVLRGWYSSKYGTERYKDIQGQSNEADKYKQMLADDKFQFQSKGLGGAVSGAAELLGQMVYQITNPRSAGMGMAAAGTAAAAGQLGPQVLLPEEIVTVPGAFITGVSAGGALTNYEIMTAQAYDEMLENGIDEKTARTVATITGLANSAIESVQLDELFGAYKVLKGADGVASQTLAKTIAKELAERGVDVLKETGEEMAQEAVTMAGVDYTLHKAGKDGFTAEDYAQRIADTGVQSALSFGVLNIPSAGVNTYSTWRNRNSGQDAVADSGEVTAENVVEPEENVVETVEKEAAAEEQAQQLEDTGITAETAEILQQIADENGAELEVDLPDNTAETEQQTSDFAENNVPEMAEFEAVEGVAETEEEKPVTDVPQEQTVENPVETVETVEPVESIESIESIESVEERTEDAQTREILEQLASGAEDTSTEPVAAEQNVPQPVNLQSVSSVLGELGVGEAGIKRAEKMFSAANGNAVDFAKEFVPIYNAGVKGEAVPEARGNTILSGAQRMLVYNSGRADAIKQVPNTAASDIMEAETHLQTINTVTEEGYELGQRNVQEAERYQNGQKESTEVGGIHSGRADQTEQTKRGTEKNNGQTSYRKVTRQENAQTIEYNQVSYNSATENTRVCIDELHRLNVPSDIHEGDVVVNGNIRGNASQGRTFKSGFVLVKNGLDIHGLDIAGHEALHSHLRRNTPAALEYKRVFDENFLIGTEKSNELVEALSKGGYENDLSEEIAAFMGGWIHHSDGDGLGDFAECLDNEQAVRTAWNNFVNTVAVKEDNNGTENIPEVYDGGRILEPDTSGQSAGGLLDGIPAEDVHTDESEGDTVSDNRPDGRGTERPAGGTDEGRVSGGRSLGSSEGTDLQPSTGEITENVNENVDAADETDSPAPLAAETVEEQIEQKTELATQDNDKGHNFVYTEKGGVKIPTAPKARFKANVDAIKTLRNIKAENRRATPAEQEILAKYTGWGGVTQAFDEKSADWAKEYKQLKKLLTEEEYKTARGSILDAYYTENDIIRGMFKGLEKIGFKGGRLLEPSCGIGKFIGAMPQEMLGSIKSWSAVELDKVTGEIAKYLYPDADVRVQGFQDANLPDNYMDVVIGNVPFGSFGVTDKAFPPAVTKLIHNYFIAKSIRKARPGGIVCVITTKGTLDAAGTEARQQFMKEADLIGAIRLPNTAFKSTGTPVVSDILVFKKREANTPYKGEPFLNVQRVNAKDYSYYGDMNEYFVNHPEMVLGKPAMERGRYGVDITYTPLDSRYSLGVQIERAFAKITAQMEYPAVQDQRELIREVKAATSKAKNGAIVHKDGKFFVNKGGVLEEHKVSKADADRLKGIIAVRDGARELLNLQLENADEDRIKESRAKLNRAYDSFVEKYGYLGHENNQKLFNADTDKPFIISLENTDKNTGAVTKAEIFSKNTVTPIKVVTHADSVSEGLTVSLNEFGRIDVDRIAQLTGETAQTVVDELISNNLAYFDRNGNLETAEQYLSGNVRAKLKDAKALAEGDSRYKRNVAALEKVVPEDIAPEDIKVRLGATWVPDDIYSQFASEKLGTGKDYRGNWNISVKYNRQLGKFFVENHSPYLVHRPENTTEWGTNERPFVGNENNSLLVAALNNKQVTVYRKGPNDTRVVDRDATKAAQDKLAKLLTEFGEWLWKDDKRRAELGQMYNDIFNGVVTPKYDGSNLTIDGITPDPNRQMRPHQKNVVQRIINSGGNTLIAHRVGAGKTYEMSAAAMKLRQLGIVKKPVIIAPKHLVGQWGDEFLSYFPAAKILVLGDGDFIPAKRKLFANRIATGDWDAVIMSYEQFGAVPMSESSQQAFYQEQIDNLEMAIIEAKAAQGKDPSVREMERSKRSFEEKLKALASKSKKDKDNISFEELGIDALFVDEAHNFKNLFYITKMKGIADLGDKNGNGRTLDLYSKVQYLQKLNGGRGIVFATATPIMNSAVEMYTMQRYLQADKLEAMGLSTFDAWANQFGDIVEIDRYKVSGNGLEKKLSLAKYKNLAELQQMFRSFADVITDAAELPYLKIPKMKGGKRIVVECDAGEFQKSFMEELGQRAEALRGKGGKYIKGNDHPLKIYNEGKNVSFSQKMINPDMPYEARGKIMACVENVYSIWNATTKVTGSGKHKADKGTQLIFCDRGVPGGADAERGVNIYADMKNLLVGMEIPAEEIAFIHDAKKDEEKTELFKKVNEGKVRILIGSSGKMGTGMNAQKRIVAIHEINAPDRPGDLEQLEGRGLRQGNLNDEVAIYAYITKGTFDASQWDRLKRKATFIHQVMAGEYSGREAEGDGEFAIEAAEIAAIASDNPLIMEHHQVSEKINTLSSLQRAHLKAVNEAKARIAQTEKDIILYKDLVEKYTADIAVRTDTSGDKFKVVVDGKTYTERKAAGEALIAKSKKLLKMADVTENNTLVGSFAGLSLYVTNKGNLLLKGQAQYRKAVNMDSAVGTVQSLEAAVKGIEKQLETANNMLDEAQKALPKLQKAAAAPFERAAELQELIVRENEIISILRPENERNQYVIDEEVTDEPEEHYSKTAGDGTDEWTATRSKGNKAEAKSLTEIISKASHDLGIHVTTGHVRGKGFMGVYSWRSKGVRLRKTNDLPIVAHEFGHALDDRYKIVANLQGDVKQELLDNYPDGLKALYSEKEHPFEALAEFVRQYLQNKDEAMAKYPKAAPHFLNTLSATDRAQFEQFADEVNAYFAAEAETATSVVRLKEEKAPDYRTAVEKLEDKYNVFRQAWVDAYHGIKRFDIELGTNIYRKACNAAYAQNKAANILEKDLTDIHGKVIGPGLKAALKGINLRNTQEYKLFGEYLIVKHGPERLKEGMDVFADKRQNNEAWMLKRQAELEQQYPAFKKASERLYQFIADFHKVWGVDTGIISRDSLDEWQKRWEYYVPFNRAFMADNKGKGAKRSLVNQSNPYKKAKGSTRDFIHPVDNIIDNVIKMVNISERNSVALAMADAAINIGADAAFIEKIPTPMAAQQFDLTELKDKLRDEATENLMTGELNVDGFIAVNNLITGLDDVLTQYSRGKAYGDVVTVLRGGKPEYWKVNDEGLLESLTTMMPAERNLLMQGIAATTRFITGSITGNNPVWSIFSNAPRDLVTVLVYGKNKNIAKLFRDMGVSYVNSFREQFRGGKGLNPLFSEYLAMGGGQTAVYNADSDSAKKARQKLGSATWKEKMKTTTPVEVFRYFLDAVYFAGNATETAPRFATYKYLRENGFSTEEAFYEAMDVTVNFKRGGNAAKNINKVVPFFNAGIQGVDKMARFYLAADVAPDKRQKVIMSRAITAVAVSVGLAALHYAINNYDDEREKYYEQLSTYTKNNFICIPRGDGKFFCIPKPRDIAVLMSLSERVMEYTIGDNEHAFDDVAQYAADTALPPIISDIVQYPANIAQDGFEEASIGLLADITGSAGLFGVAAQAVSNRDFLGRPIVSRSMEYLEGRQKYNQNVSRLAYELGQVLNFSPLLIDHFGENILSFWWGVQQSLVPLDPSRRDMTLGVANRYFKDSQYSTDLTNWMYDRKEDNQIAKSSNPDDMNVAIKYKNDNNMTSFYSRYYGIAKTESDTALNRATRQKVLDMIYDYQQACDNDYVTPVQKEVNAVVKELGDTSLMPGVMNNYIKDAGDVKRVLSSAEYVDYQSNFLGNYWTYVENNLEGSMSTSQKAAVITAAKDIAKKRADETVLARKGYSSGHFEEYSGVEDNDIIAFKAERDLANDDGSLKQTEVVDILVAMVDKGLSFEDAYTLFKSEYDSDKNNPWKAYKPK